ncbi:MAG: G/U mismatch-specific DNA glycosylase [Kofleriaceae bacterium]|nr:G/U mismatch-specific DNA glycosylase [Kofleriaceae bacterium]
MEQTLSLRANVSWLKRPSTQAVDRPAPTWKPSHAQLAAASSKRLRDVIAPGLKVLFVGINPGLYSAAVGHHFARPGNRFWPTLFAAGFTPRLFTGFDDRALLDLDYGITNLVARTTATADELTKDELVAGARILRRKILRMTPRFVAFVGLTAYRTAFGFPKAQIGLQEVQIAESRLWLLPNPSGLNAHHQPADLKRLFSRLREATR